MAEWEAGVDFLLRAGQISFDPKKRHEWMFLSDTLGVTMLVDCINHRRRSACGGQGRGGDTGSVTRKGRSGRTPDRR